MTGPPYIVTFTVPATAAAGDLLVVHIVNFGGSVTPPAGFTVVSSVTQTSLVSSIYQKVATASDPTTSYVFNASTNQVAGGYAVLRGAATIDPAAIGTGSSLNSTTVTASSVTAAAPALLLTFAGAALTGATFSTPTGMTNTYTAAGTQVSLGVWREARAAGATGTRQTTASGGSGWNITVAQNVAVQPGPTFAAVSWSDPAATGDYEVQRGGSVLGRVSTQSYLDTPLSNGSYTWSIRAAAGQWRSSAASVGGFVTC